jgi:hypothetical protein
MSIFIMKFTIKCFIYPFFIIKINYIIISFLYYYLCFVELKPPYMTLVHE